MSLKKNLKFIPILFSISFFFFILGLFSCQKTNSPLGSSAPLGFDYPSHTPTPTSGSIEVYVIDAGTAIQGVSVIVLDPTGNTLGPNLTQPVVGYASFNPPNLIRGTWTAKVLTQGVSYVTGSYASPITINYYYYQTSQPFTVTSSGFYPVTFSTNGNTVSVAPVSLSYGLTPTINLPITVTYNQTGNLNVPVSVTFPSLPPSIFPTPSVFIFGEGVTQQPVTLAKTGCFAENSPIQISSNDFTGTYVITNPVTIFHSYPVSIFLYGQNDSDTDPDCSGYCYSVYFDTTNGCYTDFSYSITDSTEHTTLSSGIIYPGSSNSIEWNGPANDNISFTISSPYVGTFTGNTNTSSFPGNNNWSTFYSTQSTY